MYNARTGGGRAVYGHVIIKFSGMGRFIYPWCSATNRIACESIRFFRLKFLVEPKKPDALAG